MIREFKADDIDVLIAVWQKASEKLHDYLSEESRQQMEEYIRGCIANFETTTYLFLLKKRCVAFITLSDRQILWFYVIPECQNRCIGTKLLNHVKSKLDSLTLTVQLKNIDAIRFYERNGFQADGHPTTDSFNELQVAMSWCR